MKPYGCPACGTGIVELRRSAPERLAYRNLKEIEVPSVDLPICSKCGEAWLDREATERYHHALEAVYAEALSLRAEQALATLQKHVRLRDLERALGVSAGYFSKLKSGKSTSGPLVSLLLLLAARPERLEELHTLLNPPDALAAAKPPDTRSPVSISDASRSSIRAGAIQEIDRHAEGES